MEELLITMLRNSGPTALSAAVCVAIYLMIKGELSAIRQAVAGIKEDVQEMKGNVQTCQVERRAVEADLFGRITANTDRVSRVEGRLTERND